MQRWEDVNAAVRAYDAEVAAGFGFQRPQTAGTMPWPVPLSHGQRGGHWRDAGLQHKATVPYL